MEKRPMDENEQNEIQDVGRHVTKFAWFGGLMIFKSEKGIILHTTMKKKRKLETMPWNSNFLVLF